MTGADRSYPAGWPPEDTVFPIAAAELCVLDGVHPFHRAQAAPAWDNWQAEIAANPALFDGQMVFFDGLSISGGHLRAVGHMVPFSTFLWWRRQKPSVTGFHLYGWAIPVSSDGAIIAIRMAGHTANPGQVYCAAGSLDGHDVIDGRCDLHGNMCREVGEETGLDLSAAQPLSGLFAVHRDRRVTLFRYFRFEMTADAMLARIAAHMLADAEKEIAGAVAIRSSDPTAHPYNAMMLPVLALFFDRGLPDEKLVAST